jgi:O-antigen/teichoic acid export membrane protein
MAQRKLRFLEGFRLEQEAFVYFGGRVAAGVGIVLLIPALSRGLGAEGYGQYGYLMALMLLVAQLGSGWLQQAVLRFLPGDQATEVRSAVMLLRWISGVLTMVVLFVTGLLTGTGVFLAAIMGLFGLVWAWFTTGMAFGQSALRPVPVVIAESLRAFLPLALVLLWLLLPFRFSVPVALLFITAGLAAAAWMLNRGQVTTAGVAGHRLFRELFVYGAPIGLWLGLSVLQFFIGRAALKLYADPAALGLYSALQDLGSKGVGLLMIPLLHALYPRMMQAWSRFDTTEARQIYLRGLVYAVLLMLGMVGGAWILGERVVYWLFGDQLTTEILPSGSSFRYVVTLFILSEGLAGMALFTHKGYELTNRTLRMAGVMVLCLGVNLLLLYVFNQFPGGINLISVVVALIATRLIYVVITLISSIKKMLPKTSSWSGLDLSS